MIRHKLGEELFIRYEPLNINSQHKYIHVHPKKIMSLLETIFRFKGFTLFVCFNGLS